MSDNDARFTFTWRAKAALVKRAKEITPTSIDMLVRMLPGTIEIVNAIWHEFPEETMEKVIRNEAWKDVYNVPNCIDDYVLRSGKEILKKYDKIPFMVMILLSHETDATYRTDGMRDVKTFGEHATPDTYVTYLPRVKRYPKRLKDNYLNDVIDRMGEMIASGKLTISVPERRL
jgi:hypothetical protein